RLVSFFVVVSERSDRQACARRSSALSVLTVSASDGVVSRSEARPLPLLDDNAVPDRGFGDRKDASSGLKVCPWRNCGRGAAGEERAGAREAGRRAAAGKAHSPAGGFGAGPDVAGAKKGEAMSYVRERICRR